MRLNLVLSIILSVTLWSCADDAIDPTDQLDYELGKVLDSYSMTGSKDYYILPDQSSGDRVPEDPKNPLSPDKIALGKFLFFETGIALDAKYSDGMGTYSCATCHIPEAGFRPGFMQGIADGGMGFGYNGEGRIMNESYSEEDLDVQSARPLSLINVAFVKNTSWNGSFGSTGVNIGTEDQWGNDEGTRRNSLGYEGIETQNIEGLHTHRMKITPEIAEELGYKELFDKSFPHIDEKFRYNNRMASFAISAYLRTIISNEAPFQDWLKGDSGAMSDREKKGAILFFGKANCNSCHYEKNLGSHEFHALGVKDMDQHPGAFNPRPNDKRNFGRGGFTNNPEELYQFKVPGLYNSSDTEFYFHGSSKTSLREVIEYKINAEKENDRVPQSQMSPKLRKIDLTDEEIDDLVLFLEKSLRDTHLQRYKPDYIKSGNCFPNNDYISQEELSCN